MVIVHNQYTTEEGDYCLFLVVFILIVIPPFLSQKKLKIIIYEKCWVLRLCYDPCNIIHISSNRVWSKVALSHPTTPYCTHLSLLRSHRHKHMMEWVVMVDMIGAHTKTNTWIQPGLLRRFFGSLHPRRFANSNFKRTWGRCKESWGKWKMSPATSLRHKSLYTDHSRWSCWK